MILLDRLLNHRHKSWIIFELLSQLSFETLSKSIIQVLWELLKNVFKLFWITFKRPSWFPSKNYKGNFPNFFMKTLFTSFGKYEGNFIIFSKSLQKFNIVTILTFQKATSLLFKFSSWKLEMINWANIGKRMSCKKITC